MREERRQRRDDATLGVRPSCLRDLGDCSLLRWLLWTAVLVNSRDDSPNRSFPQTSGRDCGRAGRTGWGRAASASAAESRLIGFHITKRPGNAGPFHCSSDPECDIDSIAVQYCWLANRGTCCLPGKDVYALEP